MSDHLSKARKLAIVIARSAKIDTHVGDDVYLYSTSIKDFFIIAGVDASAEELAEAILTYVIVGLEADELLLADEQRLADAVLAQIERLLTAQENQL
jgi:hypothetical protein